MELRMNDQQISTTLLRLRDDAIVAGFTLDASRGDGMLELMGDGNRRITFETRFIHGSGRVILNITRGDARRIVQIEVASVELSEGEAYKDARQRMLAVVRRVMAVKP